uniref:Ceramide synthase 6 n=2 Tax=Cacopsylla melanoneura TaxID=428564 RepID=A0A8D8Y989_9HEMI
MGIIRTLLDGFWNPYIWLPPNITWADLEQSDPNSKIQYPDHRHLFYPLPMALGMLVLRYFLEKFWFAPIGTSVGIKNIKKKPAPSNEVLCAAYSKSSKWKHKEIAALAKQLDWKERQVERWLRQMKQQGKPSILVKFCESSWRCFYYFFSFIFGFVCLWDKEWLWNIDNCWVNYPHQSVANDVWWYYMISLSFYYSLAVSQFFDVKRKDFWQMFLHHICTICLLSFSWMCNLTRIGTLVLIVHDCADIFLEAAKMAKYSKFDKTCEILFLLFTFLWLLTRNYIFPFWIIRSTSMDAPKIANTMFPAYYLFNGLLILLFILHLFWTRLIIKIAFQYFRAGEVGDDLRSSSSGEDVSDESGKSANGSVVNNASPKKVN